MKAIVFLTLMIFGCITADEQYTDIYDNTNVTVILTNDRIFEQYLACLLDNGPCTADARAFKTMLPEAIATYCAKCSPKQQGIARDIGAYLTKHRPEAWALIMKKFDPFHEHADKFQKFLAGEPLD